MQEAGDEYGPSVRAARTVWLLIDAGPHGVTTDDIAKHTGLSHSGAWKMINRLAVTIPVYQDGGRWRLLPRG